MNLWIFLGLPVFQQNYRISPAIALGDSLIKSSKTLNSFVDGDETLQNTVEEATKTLEIAFGYPVSLNNIFFNVLDYMFNGMTPEISDITKRRPKSER